VPFGFVLIAPSRPDSSEELRRAIEHRDADRPISVAGTSAGDISEGDISPAAISGDGSSAAATLAVAVLGTQTWLDTGSVARAASAGEPLSPTMGSGREFGRFNGVDAHGFNRNAFGNMAGWNAWGNNYWGAGWNDWGEGGWGYWAGPAGLTA
jgi:hypothetical protein